MAANLSNLAEESRHEKECSRIIEAKRAQFIVTGSKCDNCWQKKKYCICKDLHGLVKKHKHLYTKFKFIIYMSREEYLCGGNSGHLLSILCPEQTTTFIYGCRDESQRLRDAILNSGSTNNKVCVLFPGSDAITVKEWMKPIETTYNMASNEVNDKVNDEVARVRGDVNGDSDVNGNGDETNKIESYTVILVDGSWRKARRMAQHLQTILLPCIKHVTLTITGDSLISSFHRKQSQSGRICTIEALALFITECLENMDKIDNTRRSNNDDDSQCAMEKATDADIFTSIIKQSIELHNISLAPKKDPILWVGNGGSPCWYFGYALENGDVVN